VIQIFVQDDFRDLTSDQLLSTAAEATLRLCGMESPPSLSIRVSDDQELMELNQRYRGMDQPTDVLSFSADFMDPDLGTRYLGDVVISYPRAEEQASRRGHQTGEELQLLVVHGVLHLLGYDHASPAEKARMWSLQQQVLEELDLDIQVEDL
jgi:probable rRNA maturation factor